MMGRQIGSSRLGDLYGGGSVRTRREWRGLGDTWYDYTRWLKNMGMLGKFVMKPNNIKGFFRYRWMMNYLAVPMMIDKHTIGLRGNPRQVHDQAEKNQRILSLKLDDELSRRPDDE